MQFFKSLFCWQGFDNRLRFISVSVSCYLLFILYNQIFTDSTLITSFVLSVFSIIYLATTRRRLNDIKLLLKWTFAPAVSFLICGLLVIFTDNNITSWLLFLSLSPMLWLVTYPSKHKRTYILGYYGPVDLTHLHQETKVRSVHNKRVEPTINSLHVNTDLVKDDTLGPSNNTHTNDSINNSRHSTSNTQHQNDLAQRVRLALVNYKYSRIIFAIVIILLLLSLISSLLVTSSTQEQSAKVQSGDVIEAADQFQHMITLPDNFTVMFSASQALVLKWPANVEDNQEIWSLSNAQGDKNCTTIDFNSAVAIRTYRVRVEQNNYYAYFSPLDTQTLIKNIAFKNSFTLCGYNFSLKGSQATLVKSPFYANLIEY